MIDNRGYEVIPENDYRESIMEDFKLEFPNMSDSPSNLISIIASIMARNENRRDYDRVAAYANAYIATANGMHLSKAVRTAGLNRLTGTKAVGKVRITKSDDVKQLIIPSKTRIKSNELIYETNNSSTLIINEESIEVEIVSVENGVKNNISSMSKFETELNIRGIKEIISVTDISGGTNEESDAALRQRYYRRMSAYTNSSLRGIVDAVRNCDGVVYADGIENNTDVKVGALLPHSFTIFAQGGEELEIATSIFTTKPAGIPPLGEIIVEVDMAGRKHQVGFSRFSTSRVYYDIEVAIDRSIASPDFVDDLKNIIIDYTAKNKTIAAYEIVNYIAQNIDEVRGVRQIKFGTSPNPTQSETIVAQAGKLFVTNPESIKVVVL